MDRDHAFELPYSPPFLEKHGGWVFSLGQFLQYVGNELMASGTVQVWPGMPVAEALLDDAGERVCGVRLLDQGVDREGRPDAGYMPGMDIRAALTVVGDGPVGAVGRQLDEHFGLPAGHHQREWALGMKMVVDLPAECELAPGTVIHTFGYPEPEIFGFFYVHAGPCGHGRHFRAVVVPQPHAHGLPLPAALHAAPVSVAHLKGGRLRSWGAKSLQESGRRGEPFLVGEGYARIGEGSGSTNVLTGSGVDEAWTTGAQLAEAVVELLKQKLPLNRENLERTYVARRRASWVEEEGRIAEKARDGFHQRRHHRHARHGAGRVHPG